MDITRKLAIQILKYLDKHQDFYFPFSVMCKEYSDGDGDFVEIEPEEWKLMKSDKKYQTFQLWENLQNLYEETVDLMSRGFIEKITNESLETSISGLAKECKKYWKEDMWLTHKTADYGENEFLGGKIEAYEDCLDLIRSYSK